MRQMIYRMTLVLMLVAACAKSPQEADQYDPARDYFSFANTDQFIMQNLSLDLVVDFDAQELRGSAVLSMRRLDETAAAITLDTRDITVSGASVELAGSGPVAADYEFGASDPIKGRPLIVELPDAAAEATEFDLRLEYATSPDASALQWLPPELTSGGKHPLMFSQSQAIHARSWVPLQDTPAVRITYDAVIKTPPELLAVMSADNDPKAARRGEYRFTMPQPIPPYLLAIAVGNIFFAPVGEQTGVYAEPELLDASVWEFADTQKMLERAEQLFGPYEWGRYDLLVLPPSFPYGGMENPRLSFITPSLLAGDRSLVSVVAHELAHSWSGNLVTNATWRDQWLNEGMTSYLESRLMEDLYGEDRVDEERVLAYEELLLDLESVPKAMQALAPRLDTGDPDDFQGTIHYNKGQLFLVYLENAFGRDAFDRFLFTYFADFAFQTITTERFLDYLDENLLSTKPDKVSREQAEQWIYGPGLPDDITVPVSSTLEAAKASAAAWSQGEIDASELPVDDWSPQALVHFINALPEDLSNERLQMLDRTLALSTTRNAEIGRTWFIQVAKRRYTDAYPALEEYLNRYGRGRLVRPIYAALASNGTDLELARELFANARAAYHPYVENGVARVLELEKK